MARAPESFEKCVGRVAKAGKIGRADALKLLQQVDDRAQAMLASGTPDPYLKAAAELAAQETETARLDRLDALRNAVKRTQLLSKVTGYGNAAQVLRDVLHGSNVGSRENVQSEWLGRAAQVLGAIEVQLKKAGIQKAVTRNGLDREIARALWAKNAKGEEAKVSAPAKAAADAFHPALDQMRDMQNAHGARIGDAPDYVMHTWHDPLLMRRGGRGGNGTISVDDAFAAWWKWTEPKLAEKTFDGLETKEGENDAAARVRFGRSVFNALVSGIHMRPEGVAGVPTDEAGNYIPPAYEGTHNIAKKVSHQRVLFWQDADAWTDYNQKYGRYLSLYDGVQSTVRQGSRNIALMDKLGTNPAGNLNTVIRRIEEKYRNEDLDGLKQFQKKIPGIQNVMARLDGAANVPVDSLFASLSEGARQYYDSISLGGVGVTHMASSFATIPGELRHHGIGAATDSLGVGNLTGGIANVGRVMGIILRGKGPIERQEILADTGAYASGFAYNLAKNWNLIFEPGNTPMGRVSAIHSLFMNASGVNWWFESMGYGLREMASANLGRQIGQEFGTLHPLLQNMLSKYGIGKEQWDQLRGVQDLKMWEGRTYLTPSDALRSPGGQELADKLLMYYQDIADHGRVVPGVRERALLQGAERPGSLGYEIRRMLTQFKIWPVAAMHQVMGRELNMNLTKGGMAAGILLTLGMSTAAGYTRMLINDVLRGNPPRDPRQPSTMLAALSQGGGIGILGDLMFGNVNRMGSGGVTVLGGPIISDLDALARIYGRWRENLRTGKTSDFWPDLARFASNHVPMANLVYLKGSMDYLVWFSLFEAMKPGWWERSNRRIEKESGRSMQGYVPGGGVPRGIPGLYLRNNAGQSFGLLGNHGQSAP
jgi:hypothetical protein